MIARYILCFLWGATLASGWWAVAVFKPGDGWIVSMLVITVATALVGMVKYTPVGPGDGE